MHWQSTEDTLRNELTGDNGWETALIWLALTPLIVLLIYSIYKFYCILRFLFLYFGPFDTSSKPGYIPAGDEPLVSVLISCYNEAQVIRRTIDAACSMEWPADKLEVCILDDSTDVTKEIVDEAAAEWTALGITCRVIRRPIREGYKAGNLNMAQKHVRGSFHAMFDADHIAQPGFLQASMPHFFDENGVQKMHIGLVQSPWAYYNLQANTLTQCDGLMLDVHHVIEQRGRSRAFNVFSFNGTGGVWRKEAVESGGGWTWDTVTEDLDLSYRGCLNGFRFVYVEDGPCALEIPARISAFKSQKYRWDQGFMQVSMKSLIDLMVHRGASIALKLEMFFHLTGGIQYPCTLWTLCWTPILGYFNLRPSWVIYVMLFIIFTILLQVLLAVYLKPAYQGDYTSFWARTTRLWYIIPAMLLNIGMSVNASMAVWAGIFSSDAVFIRTPKDGGHTDVDGDETAVLTEEAERDKQRKQELLSYMAGDKSAAAPGTTAPAAGGAGELGEEVKDGVICKGKPAAAASASSGSALGLGLGAQLNDSVSGDPGSRPRDYSGTFPQRARLDTATFRSGRSQTQTQAPPIHGSSSYLSQYRSQTTSGGGQQLNTSAFNSVTRAVLVTVERLAQEQTELNNVPEETKEGFKQRFINNRRKRRQLPAYTSNFNLKYVTIFEVFLACYFIFFTAWFVRYETNLVDIVQLCLLVVPSFAFGAFAFAAVKGHVIYIKDAIKRSVLGAWDSCSYCCCRCLCGDDRLPEEVHPQPTGHRSERKIGAKRVSAPSVVFDSVV